MFNIVAISWITFILCVIVFLYWAIRRPKIMKIEGVHALVTGGSSGIGLEIAKDLVRRGAMVTIMARNKSRLSEAESEILKCVTATDKQIVQSIASDVTDPDSIKQAVEEAEKTFGPVLMLVNCAGFSISRSFDDLECKDFKTMMDINYLGSVYTTKAVIPTMKASNRGRVVFLSSQAGQLGLFGFSAYSASKFALMGLGQALQMEVNPYNIHVTLSFPPDTDTPGYKKELDGKPKETCLISETAGLYQPEYVAQMIVNDSLKGKFQSSIGIDGYLLSSITCGMTPAYNVLEAVQQILTMGVFRLVSLFYVKHFDSIVSKCKIQRDIDSKKST